MTTSFSPIQKEQRSLLSTSPNPPNSLTPSNSSKKTKDMINTATKVAQEVKDSSHKRKHLDDRSSLKEEPRKRQRTATRIQIKPHDEYVFKRHELDPSAKDAITPPSLPPHVYSRREIEMLKQENRMLSSQYSSRSRHRHFSEDKRYAPYRRQEEKESSLPRGVFHQLPLRVKYVHQIQKGQKTIEGRVFDGSIRRYKQGDTIKFFYQQNLEDHVICRINQIRYFSSFREMLENCGYKNCLPDVHSLEEAIEVYHQIPNYKTRAKQNGVVAISLTVQR